MSNTYTLITVMAMIAFVVSITIGTHRYFTTRASVDANFTRSLTSITGTKSELDTSNANKRMPPTYTFWLTQWKSSGRTAPNPRTPGNIAVALFAAGVLFGVTVFPTGIMGVIVGGAGIAAFYMFLSTAASKRIGMMEKQLPLLLSGLRSQISAGVTPQTALIDIADSIPLPLGTELSTIKNELATGVSMETALNHFAQRVPTRQVQFLVASMEIAISAGSDLHPQLIVIEEIYEQRARIAGKIRSALALVRPTAWLAEGAPIAALLWTVYSDPAAVSYFLGSGLIMFIAGCALYAIGVFAVHAMMRKLTANTL